MLVLGVPPIWHPGLSPVCTWLEETSLLGSVISVGLPPVTSLPLPAQGADGSLDEVEWNDD